VETNVIPFPPLCDPPPAPNLERIALVLRQEGVSDELIALVCAAIAARA